ncbi:MAG TPA: glyoxalase/bleomycin resistance/extradiol dioxygenase family protein [Xanthobacteraceae bacterium]|nr:glyoxalase/bleomycin resistance/extradiol dioxygenase family protein [Xanthobacteraceae bacterium]
MADELKEGCAGPDGAQPAVEHKPVPTKGGLVAYLQVGGANKAAAFYERAFGATIVNSYPEDDQGRTMHVHLYVNGTSLMLSDPYPEHGYPLMAPQAFTLTLMLDNNIDEVFQRAVEAGAEIVMPVADTFWGARYGQLRDPFGVLWAMNQEKR